MEENRFPVGTKVLVNWDKCKEMENRDMPYDIRRVGRFCEDILQRSDIIGPLTVSAECYFKGIPIRRLEELGWWVPLDTLSPGILRKEVNNDKHPKGCLVRK